MKYFIIINIFISFWTEFNHIHEINKIKKEAEIAFKNKDNKKAIQLYYLLVNSFKLKDENIRLNLAHSCYKATQVSHASYHYKILTNSTDNIIRSVAFHQLGMIYETNGNNQLALSYFKQAVKTNPNNEKARYNYEIIKKNIDQNNKLNIEQKNRQEKINKNTSSERSDETKKLNSKGEQKKEFQPDNKGNKNIAILKTRLIEVNINEEKAKIILESMKDAEVQYLQQRKHHEYNKGYENKPNW